MASAVTGIAKLLGVIAELLAMIIREIKNAKSQKTHDSIDNDPGAAFMRKFRDKNKTPNTNPGERNDAG